MFTRTLCLSNTRLSGLDVLLSNSSIFFKYLYIWSVTQLCWTSLSPGSSVLSKLNTHLLYVAPKTCGRVSLVWESVQLTWAALTAPPVVRVTENCGGNQLLRPENPTGQSPERDTFYTEMSSWLTNSSSATWIIMVMFMVTGGVVGQLDVDYLPEEIECPGPTTKMLVNDIPWGVPGRAYLSLPDGLLIARSKIPNAGLGIISTTFIRRSTWLGEYEGEIVPVKDADDISLYTWTVHRNGEATAYLDAFHGDTSTYVRWINTPNRHVDENVWALECYGKVFYVTSRDIVPGEELLVFYGIGYSLDLGFDLNDYFDVAPVFRDHGLDLNNETHRNILADLDIEYFDLCKNCQRHLALTNGVLNLKTKTSRERLETSSTAGFCIKFFSFLQCGLTRES